LFVAQMFRSATLVVGATASCHDSYGRGGSNGDVGY